MTTKCNESTSGFIDLLTISKVKQMLEKGDELLKALWYHLTYMCSTFVKCSSWRKKLILLAVIWSSNILKVNWKSLHITIFILSQSQGIQYEEEVEWGIRRREAWTWFSQNSPYPTQSHYQQQVACNSREDQEEGRKGRIFERISREEGRRIGRRGEKVAGAPLQRSVWLHLQKKDGSQNSFEICSSTSRPELLFVQQVHTRTWPNAVGMIR